MNTDDTTSALQNSDKWARGVHRYPYLPQQRRGETLTTNNETKCKRAIGAAKTKTDMVTWAERMETKFKRRPELLRVATFPRYKNWPIGGVYRRLNLC